MLAVSALLHLVALLLFLYAPAPEETLDQPSEQSVTMLFDAGQKAAKTTQGPADQPAPNPETAAPPAPGMTDAPPPGPETTEPAAPVPAPVPAPPLPAPSPEPPPPEPPPPPAVPVPASPTPASQPAPPPAPAHRALEPTPTPAPPVPEPAPPPAPAPPAPSTALPALRPPAPPAAAPPRPTAVSPPRLRFPAPMQYSFGNQAGPDAPPARSGGARPGRSGSGAVDFSLGPLARNSLGAPPRDNGPANASIQVRGAHVGGDWIGLLEQWWLKHRFYPPQAAERGEDGPVQLHLVVDRYGHVQSVDLQSGSGSQFLDLGALGLFRHAHLPAFPPSTPEQTADLDLTINYILIRH